MNQKIFGSRYQVINLLGKKPGYRTILCRDIHTQQLVVIKFLIWDEDFEWQNLKLLEREAQVLQNISHPAIPRYLDYFEVNQPHLTGFALVQNYIKAASLEEYLQAGRTFNIEEVKQLAESLLDILNYLHSLKYQIIHRDIKPSNILLTNRSGNNIGDVYLVDFGSVKALTASTVGTMTVVGTYGYMSPEHFGGRVVPSSDLYSLGASLIYLVTGMHPANLPQKDGRIKFEQLVNCPEDFSRWLKRMVEPVKESRFISAKSALKALKQAANNRKHLVKKDARNHSRNLTNIKKPFGSKIALKKSKNWLEVLIPAPGISKLKSKLIIFILKMLSYAILLPLMSFIVVTMPIFAFRFLADTIFVFHVLFGIIYMFIWLGIYAGAIALIISIINDVINLLVNLFQRERLKINLQQLCWTSEFFCFKFKLPYLIPLNKIDSFDKKLFVADGNNSKWGIVANLGTHQYKLTNNSNLTEVEVNWLCNELNQYLNISKE